MRYKYIGSSNTATNGATLGAVGQDVLVHKLIIGAPVASGNIYLYNSTVAVGASTDNLAAKITLSSSFGAGTDSGLQRVIDFGPKGLQLDGGNVQIDQTMQVTVIWEELTVV